MHDHANPKLCECLACALRELFAARFPDGSAGMSERDREIVLFSATELAGVTLSDMPDERLRVFVLGVDARRTRARAEDLASAAARAPH